ncbi:hypothetical protein C3492_43150 [Streptomyces sp. Ru62]|nr:hypothetical protein C3492_43150 [Streptomyces sp. Ru62]
MTTPDELGSAAYPTTPGLTMPQPSSGRPFDDLVRQLKDDCKALGVGTPVSLRVRVALRRRLQLRLWKRILLLGVLYLFALTAASATLYWALHFGPWRGAVEGNRVIYWLAGGNPRRAGSSHSLSPAWEQALQIAGAAGILMFIIFVLLGMWAEVQVGAGRVRSQLAQISLARRYAIVLECAEVIHACALSRAGGERRPARFKRISKQLRAVRRAVLNAHSSRGSVPLFSPRRRRVKLHQRCVAAALLEIEAKLDRTPSDALRELAEALLTIADRYCQGRVGELLDEEQLTGVPHQRNWDVLRYLIALVLAGVAITGVAITGVVPESAETYVYGILLVAAFAIVLGRHFRRAFDVLTVITGGP